MFINQVTFGSLEVAIVSSAVRYYASVRLDARCIAKVGDVGIALAVGLEHRDQ